MQAFRNISISSGGRLIARLLHGSRRKRYPRPLCKLPPGLLQRVRVGPPVAAISCKPRCLALFACIHSCNCGEMCMLESQSNLYSVSMCRLCRLHNTYSQKKGGGNSWQKAVACSAMAEATARAVAEPLQLCSDGPYRCSLHLSRRSMR